VITKPSKLDRDLAKHARRQSRATDKRRAKADAAKTWQRLCDLVTVRDRGRCRVCHVLTHERPDADPRTRAHRHHVVYRSAGGADTLDNVVLLCGQCHDDEHQHRIDISGNAKGLKVKR
jgi:5-methylcytosine-specific restriction endonuclease McrA